MTWISVRFSRPTFSYVKCLTLVCRGYGKKAGKMVKILNVAEKNDAAKSLAEIMSGGHFRRVSKICRFTCTLRPCSLLLLLLLFEIRNRIVPTGSTPEGGPTEVSPTTQATRHPRALLLFMFPIPPYLLSCILHPVSPLPRPPVLYRYPTKYLVCPLPVFLSYTHI